MGARATHRILDNEDTACKAIRTALVPFVTLLIEIEGQIAKLDKLTINLSHQTSCKPDMTSPLLGLIIPD